MKKLFKSGWTKLLVFNLEVWFTLYWFNIWDIGYIWYISAIWLSSVAFTAFFCLKDL